MTEEGDLKLVVKDFLAIKGIYSYALLQGLGSVKGLPDRVMHFKKKVHYLEIKGVKGKLSEYQLAFQAQCKVDKIHYWVIRSLEELQAVVENE